MRDDPMGVRSPTSIFGRRLFLSVLLIGFCLRMGYGIVRYRTDLVRVAGPGFITMWEADGLEHVLIAKAILSGKGYIVDDSPIPMGAIVRYPGQEALFKAPLYQFFLAGIFALSGFSFTVMFPLQAVFGGLMSGLMGLIALDTFGRPRTAWYAGVAAAAHPVLVNSASQPYNENLFFLFFALTLWAFFNWFRGRQMRWAVVCGAAVGACILTRESGIPLLGTILLFGAVVARPIRGSGRGLAVIGLTALALVAPWSVRNYVRFGIVVPVANILGNNLAVGNNECIASESIFRPYWSEGACRSLDRQRAQLGAQVPVSGIPTAVRNDRIDGRLALEFIRKHPDAYIRLSLRRLWTALLPFDPRGNQRLHSKIAFVAYWLLVFPAGFAGMYLAVRSGNVRAILLGLLIGSTLLSIMAVIYWSDLRFRTGIDLLLGCFAGHAYDEALGRLPRTMIRY